MKKRVDFLSKNGFFFKKLEPFDLKALGFRQKIETYYGVDVKNYYNIIFFIDQKSRILKSNVQKYQEILYQISQQQDHEIKKKIIVINAPLCSKAKKILIEDGWRVFHVFM